MRSRRPRLVPIALAAALALTAAAAPAPAAAQSPRGALVRIPYEAEEGTLTPYTFRSAYPLVTLVYDTLLWRDRNGVPRPWLARSVRTSADGRRLTIRLARGARWHDDVALTAADVAFTLAYVRRTHHPRFTSQLRELAGLTVTGRHSLVIRLRRPSPGFRDQPLADVPILPRHIWSRQPPGVAPPGLPVGSGPYRLVRHDRGRLYRFAANDRYFRGVPGVRRIDVPIMGVDSRTLTEAFERGRVDLVRQRYLTAQPGLLERAGIAQVSGSGYLGIVLAFNLRRPVFRDLALRRAVSQALEPRRIARTVAGAINPIEPALRGLLHPRSRWATRETLHDPDVAAAQSVLQRLDGRPLRVLTSRDDAALRATAREVVRALRRAGLRATLDARRRPTYEDALGLDHARPDFELAIAASPPLASYDPDYLRAMFGAGGELNYGGYRSARFERLADRVTTTRGMRARRAAVADELRLLARDVPVVPLFFEAPIFVYRRAAWDGWTYIAGAGILDKRSFVARPPARSAGATAAPRDEARMGLLGYIAIGLFALAVMVVAVGSVRRRR